MSDSELQDILKSLERAIDQEVIQDIRRSIDDCIGKVEEAASPVKILEPTVRWKKRDAHGNPVFVRPRSSRRSCRPNTAVTTCKRLKTAPDISGTSCEVAFAPETVECFLQDLQHSLGNSSGDEQEEQSASVLASMNWSTRKSLSSERWRSERPRLINSTLAQENVGARICQQCRSNPASLRCNDCLPHPFFCAECDISMHTRHVLHNRDAVVTGFFKPVPPTTCIVDMALSNCVRPVPVEMPDTICGCTSVSLRVNPGKAIAVITINGRYDLNMPDLTCEVCGATWIAGVDDLNRSGYWPATLHFSTIYSTDVFLSFEEMKLAAPGLSCQAFLKMLDQRTVRFGRTGKISADSFQKSFFEWEAVQYEVDNICKEEPFLCPACTPDMLAVSVDGNRKHYRFKNSARNEEEAIFDGVFIAKDEDVTKFVDYIHKTTKHVSGRGVCGGEWSAARETSQRSTGKVDEEGLELAVCRHGLLLSALNMYRGEIFAYPLFLQKKLASRQVTFFCMDVTCKYWPYLQRVTKSCPELQHLLKMRPFLSVFHAKAHDFKCEVKWSGAYQCGAGLTLGEEVEQCNAFLSRIAVTTKHMSKAGRSDMLTLMAMRWNRQKMDNLASSLARRYLQTTKSLTAQLKNLEVMKAELAVSEIKMNEWVSDVKEWAEAKSTSTSDADALASRIEVLVASIKRRMQRLYKDADGSKARARMRRKIREEKGILTSVIEKYNRTVPSTETLCLETILSVETAWPWQLQHSDSVDLRTKRKVFDLINAVRRREEEKRILVGEMGHHWKSLKTRADTLKMSRLLLSEAMTDSSCDLTEEGLKGLQCIIRRKQSNISEMKRRVRRCYLAALSEAEDVGFMDDALTDDYDTDSDISE